MIILIVGPSGIGKSTTLRQLEPMLPEIVFLDLDKITAEWAVETGIVATASISHLNRTIRDPEKFFALGFQALKAHTNGNPGKHVVVDVGAGFQVAKSARRLHLQFKTISIIAAPDVAYARIKDRENSRESRSLELYHQDEFNPQRKQVYDEAHAKVETDGQSPGETAILVATILREWTQEN